MNFNIEQIVIMIDSNIPDEKPFELTNKTFYHPDLKSAQMQTFSKYPYFITERKYPKDKLYILARMGYNKILRFFFDKKYFETKLIGFYKKEDSIEKKEKKNKKEEEKEETSKQKEEKMKNFDIIASHNVQIMIELLFPTTWPAVRNLSSSHQEYIMGKKTQGISFKDTVFQKVNFGFITKGSDITSGLFSYLKVGGKIYTISRVIWLNDLLNHPVYRAFIDNFINYSLWIERERDRMERLLKNKKTKLFGRILDEGTTDRKGNKKLRIDSLNIFEEEENFKANRISLNQTEIDKRKEWHKKLEELFKTHFKKTLSLPYDTTGEHFSTKKDKEKYSDTKFTTDMFLEAQKALENKLDELPPPTLLSKNDEYIKVKKDKDNFERKFYDGVIEVLEKDKDKNKKIVDEIKDLKKKIEESRKLYPSTEESLDPSGRDYKKIQFYEDLDKLIIQMTNFKEQITKDNKSETNNSTINTLFSLAKDLMDSYNRLKQNDRVKLKGITDNFHIKLSKIVEEFKKLNVLEKIKTNYMSKGEINTKLEGEDPDVVAELKKDYSRLIEFIDKSKNLLEPKRESSNFELQETIVDYSENSKKTDPDNPNNSDVLIFKELMDKVRSEMVFLKKDNQTSDKYKKLMYVGVNGVDKNKMDKPHYEIYLAVDMMEGEINADNLEGVKCKYRGLYLGRETENFFTKYNKFEVKQHRVYVPEKDEDEQLIEKKNIIGDKLKEKVPEKKKKIKGGYTKKRSKKHHFNKTQSKKCSN